MTHEQTTFKDALEEAQRLGFAEADPTDDVEGVDRKKGSYYILFIFNQVIKLNDVKSVGISDITLADINARNSLNYKIKLIGKGTYENGYVNASVELTLIHKNHQLACRERIQCNICYR